jgi:hypothetical protein
MRIAGVVILKNHHRIVSQLLLSGILLFADAASALQQFDASAVPGSASDNAPGGLLGTKGAEKLSVSIPWVRYATGLLNTSSSGAVGAEEKIVAVALKIENRGNENELLGQGRFEIFATDHTGRSFNNVVFTGPGVGSEGGYVDLEAGGVANLVIALIVPASSSIQALHILDARNGGPALRIALTGAPSPTLVPLPSTVSSDGFSLPAVVEGRVGLWYALGQTDMRLVQFSIHDSPAYGTNASQATPLVAATVEVRNRGRDALRVSKGLMRYIAVEVSTGERVPVWKVLDASGEPPDILLQPGETVSCVLLFRGPAEPSPDTIMLAESVGVRGGLVSHRYRVPLGNSPAPNAFQAEGVLAGRDYSGSRPELNNGGGE